MANLRLLDVAIGILLLLLLISLLVTIVQEGIASIWKLRAANLSKAVVNLLGPERAELLYKHPLIMALYRPKDAKGTIADNLRTLPSYIPSSTFVIALLDTLNSQRVKKASPAEQAVEPAYPSAADLLHNARKILETVDDDALKRALLLMIGQPAEASSAPAAAGGAAATPGATPPPAAPSPPPADHKPVDPAAALRAVSAPLEKWFDSAMDRAAGWYKRQAQLTSMVIGLVIAVAANADVVYVAGRLWSDASLRASVTAAAEAFHADSGSAPPSTGTLTEQLTTNLKTLQSSTLPVGWSAGPTQQCVPQLCPPADGKWDSILLMIAGWIVTALATSLGAPFWFDLLNKALQIRSSGGRVAAANDRPSKK
jgi:hypothetical protein